MQSRAWHGAERPFSSGGKQAKDKGGGTHRTFSQGATIENTKGTKRNVTRKPKPDARRREADWASAEVDLDVYEAARCAARLAKRSVSCQILQTRGLFAPHDLERTCHGRTFASFFMVLDLRLVRLVVVRQSIFFAPYRTPHAAATGKMGQKNCAEEKVGVTLRCAKARLHGTQAD